MTSARQRASPFPEGTDSLSHGCGYAVKPTPMGRTSFGLDSALPCGTEERCPSGKKVKGGNYGYLQGTQAVRTALLALGKDRAKNLALPLLRLW